MQNPGNSKKKTLKPEVKKNQGVQQMKRGDLWGWGEGKALQSTFLLSPSSPQDLQLDPHLLNPLSSQS